MKINMNQISMMTRLGLAVALCATVASTSAFGDERKTTQGAAARHQTGKQPGYEAEKGNSMTAEGFARTAALGDVKEVRLGHIALQQSQDPAVKKLAQRMIDDHSKAYQDLKQIAETKSITLPPMTFAMKGPETGVTPDRNARLSTDTTQGEGSKAQTKSGSQDKMHKMPMSQNAKKEMAKQREVAQRLQSLSGNEFDRAYLNEMVEDHTKDVQKFEKAAQQLDDAELKAYASKVLPTLRDHLQAFQRLERAGSVTQKR